MELFLLEVEFGDDGLRLSVGKADWPVRVRLGAEEPARAGSRFKAAGGTIFRLDEGEALGLISILVQVCDVHCLQLELDCITRFDTGQAQAPIMDPQKYRMRFNGNHVNFLFQVSIRALQVASHKLVVPQVKGLLVDVPDSVGLFLAGHFLKGEGHCF